MISESFDRERLSTRENEILEYAIEGMTDIQIALKLDISPSTVNSYWVRIRGKLGHLSRTELVAHALKSDANSQIAQLIEQSAAYEQQIKTQVHQEDLLRHAECYQAAFEAMPMAALIASERGEILATNDLLIKLFGFEAGELLGEPVTRLILERRQGASFLERALLAEEPPPVRIGLDSVLYGRHQTGRTFRVLVLASSRHTSEGRIVSLVFQDFLNHIDDRRRYTVTGIHSLTEQTD